HHDQGTHIRDGAGPARPTPGGPALVGTAGGGSGLRPRLSSEDGERLRLEAGRAVSRQGVQALEGVVPAGETCGGGRVGRGPIPPGRTPPRRGAGCVFGIMPVCAGTLRDYFG